jgi:lysophospholipase L1-like esterase
MSDSESGHVVFHDVTHPPFVVTGFPWMAENGNWNRVPERIMPDIPERLAWVAPQPSGGMIRFTTDSKHIALRVTLTRAEKSALVTPAALSGFCLYEGTGRAKRFRGCFATLEPLVEYRAERPLKGEGLREFTLYTPLQNPIAQIEIGLDKDASLGSPAPFETAKPVLFYGSSITCGFCASRPGLTYPAQVCRALDAELINLGFGGNAKGEPIIADVIASLDLACFVMDYDHNTPSVEHLAQTHEPFFQRVREAQPELPIILVSAPSYHVAPEYYGQRRQIITSTYEYARQGGDELVWFVDGADFFPAGNWPEYTVDCLHPNDCGFARMAEEILPVVETVLKEQDRRQRSEARNQVDR